MLVLMSFLMGLGMLLFIFLFHCQCTDFTRLFAYCDICPILSGHEHALIVLAAVNFTQTPGELSLVTSPDTNTLILNDRAILRVDFGTSALSNSAMPLSRMAVSRSRCSANFTRFSSMVCRRLVISFAPASSWQSREASSMAFLFPQFFDFLAQRGDLPGKLMQANRVENAAGYLFFLRCLAFGGLFLDL